MVPLNLMAHKFQLVLLSYGVIIIFVNIPLHVITFGCVTDSEQTLREPVEIGHLCVVMLDHK